MVAVGRAYWQQPSRGSRIDDARLREDESDFVLVLQQCGGDALTELLPESCLVWIGHAPDENAARRSRSARRRDRRQIELQRLGAMGHRRRYPFEIDLHLDAHSRNVRRLAGPVGARQRTVGDRKQNPDIRSRAAGDLPGTEIAGCFVLAGESVGPMRIKCDKQLAHPLLQLNVHLSDLDYRDRVPTIHIHGELSMPMQICVKK